MGQLKESLLNPCRDPYTPLSEPPENRWSFYFNELLQRRLMLHEEEPGWFTGSELEDLLRDPLAVSRGRSVHISSSCILLLAGSQNTAMVRHLKRGEWFYPGGHADGNWNWFGVSVKECVEETGVQDLVALLRPQDLTKDFVLPAFVVKHHIAGSCASESHSHLDFVYLFETDTRELRLRASESSAVQWFDWRALGSQDLRSQGVSSDTRRIFERLGLTLMPWVLSASKKLRYRLPQKSLNRFADLTA